MEMETPDVVLHHNHSDEKKEDDDGPTIVVVSTADNNNEDGLSFVLSRLTLLESLVQQQAVDLQLCRSELKQERERHSKLQKRVVALQTDLQAAELERQSVEDDQQKKWQEHFLNLQKQVLATVTELNIIKDEIVKESTSLKELSAAVQEHTADQLEQREEITAMLTELKELAWDKSGYYDEGSEDCRVLRTTSESGTAATAVSAEKLDFALQSMEQEWDSRLIDLTTRVESMRLHQTGTEQKVEHKLQAHQKSLHDLGESSSYSETVEELDQRLVELELRVDVMNQEQMEAQEMMQQQIQTVQEANDISTKDKWKGLAEDFDARVNDLGVHVNEVDQKQAAMEEKVEQMIKDDSTKSDIACLEEAVQDMAKEWDDRMADLNTRIQKQASTDEMFQQQIQDVKNHATQLAEISDKLVKRMEVHAKKTYDEQLARKSLGEASNHQLEEIRLAIQRQEKNIAEIKEQCVPIGKHTEYTERLNDLLRRVDQQEVLMQNGAKKKLEAANATENRLETIESDIETLTKDQFDHAVSLKAVMSEVQVEHRNILKGLENKIDLFRGRVEYLALYIPKQREEIEALREDIPIQVGSLKSKYECLVARVKQLSVSLELSNQESGSTLAATQASLGDLKKQIEDELAKRGRLVQESQLENRGLQKMLHEEIKRREGTELGEFDYSQLIIRPEVQQMLKQQEGYEI